MSKERILITVKTYPTLSMKYGETVCTAGIREDGSWVRLYPVPFRRLDEAEQYSKYDWIECQTNRRTKDPRPESYSPINPEELKPVGRIGTENNWHARREILLKTAKVYTNMDALIIDAKRNITSLAIFKPTRVIDFISESEEREWDESKVAEMRGFYNQLDLFDDNEWRRTFKLIKKLPYSFSYRFEDDRGRSCQLQILDWEIGALYWNCFKEPGIDDRQVLEKVRAKYFDTFVQKDLHFYLGTTQQFHFLAPNPWVIVGVLPIPYEYQKELFDDV